MFLDRVSAATFDPHVGTGFTVEVAGAPAQLRLQHVQRYPPQPDGPRREPFALLFTGPVDAPLPQQIHTLAHAALGTFELFLVPLGPDPDGRPRYEAVFN